MPSLLGRLPKDSFPELLKLNNTGAGLTSDLLAVQDGSGVNSPLALSQYAISLNGLIWPTIAGTSGQVLAVQSDGTIAWTDPTGGTGGGLSDAPQNNKLYARENGDWVEVPAGLPDAPSDDGVYARENGEWVQVPDAIQQVNAQTGAGAVTMVETNPPANTAIIKSLVPGNNVSITDNAGLITFSAQLPEGTVGSVNGVLPDASGNVPIDSNAVGAVPVTGNVTMAGPINMGGQTLTGLANPVNPTDAVTLQYLMNLLINGGVIG